MPVETNYQGVLSENESLYITFYGVDHAIVQLQRIDAANTVGEVYVGNIIPKQYIYDGLIYKSNLPWAMYGFPTVAPTWTLPGILLSTTTTLKESISGRTLTIAAGAPISGNYTGLTSGTNRLNGKYLMLPPSSWAYDSTSAQSIALRDALGNPWSWSGWVFRSTGTATSFAYLETDLAVTKYFGIAVLTSGQVAVWDSIRTAAFVICTIPAGSWQHVGVVYDGTRLTGYLNGVLASGPTAYTHGTISGTVRNHISYGGQVDLYVQSVNIYNYALAAWQFDMENLLIRQDSFNGGVVNQGGTIGQGGTMYCRFVDVDTPSSVNAGVGVWAATVPAQGVGRIQSLNSTSQRLVYDMKITERGE